ncbi:hypothetical protein KC342_g8354 [Hortaea werneckii]|nr:hypothetical protein KC342_g8354 [Hortaea werneckii]KAI7070487.1 hypothetical protein KC339_g14597 [Hortaea werneckii]
MFEDWEVLPYWLFLNPHHSGAYNTALWSFIIFLVHFAFERIAYNTVGGRGLLAAEILAFVTFCWMCYARAYYLDFGTDAGESAPLIHPHKGQPIPMM